MKIISYEFNDVENNGFSFSKVEFSRVNLLVGISGSGKTRFLNTLFNVGSYAVGGKIKSGYWKLEFEVNEDNYQWEIFNKKDNDTGEIFVKKEKLSKNTTDVLVERQESYFVFKNKELPKLSQKNSCISILSEEESIKPIHNGFKRILRRYFFEGELDRAKATPFLSLNYIKKFESLKDIKLLINLGELSSKLYFLEKFFPDIFSKIHDLYREIFPYIKEIRIEEQKQGASGILPIVYIKEKNVKNKILLTDLSSGMLKVLLILTDIYSLSEDSIYIIDEYENSLGVNAIDFFPDILCEFSTNVQFFVSSHHPYLINNIHSKDWFIFHRKGSEVTIKYGEELAERFGKSKQKHFLQLVNDSFYTEGIE